MLAGQIQYEMMGLEASLHFQLRKQLHILLRHVQFQQHDAIHTLAQFFGDRRPGFGRGLAGWPEV